MKLKEYLKELQRRHVVKAGIAYLVVSWLLVQVLSILLPTFGLGPGWMKTAIIILTVGFPIWLIIAWVYDFSTEGIKKTEDVTFDPKISAKKNLQLNRLIIGGLSIALILLVVNQFRLSNKLDERQAMASMLPEFKSSIAVLAFDDLSPNQDQQWFSEGMSHEISSRLNKYKTLKIIKPASSFFYKNSDISFEIIGRELGVGYILDGTVRKSGDTFRINIELIDTQDESIIWSDSFDSKIEDSLFAQDEIAVRIAKLLKLTLENEDVLLRKVDPEAYDLYLRAFFEFSIGDDSTSVLTDSLIRKSLDIDPGYSKSWSLLSANTLFFGIYNDHLERKEAVSIGLRATNKALALDSTNVHALTWLSNWQWHNRQGNTSLRTLNKILKRYPNSYHSHGYAAHCFARMGMPKSALQHAYIGSKLNPKEYNSPLFIGLIENYMENYAKAIPAWEEYFDLYQELTGTADGFDILAWMYYKSGDLDKALETLEREPGVYFPLKVKTMINYREGYTKKADSLLREFRMVSKEDIPYYTDLDFDLAIILASKGDKDAAFKSLEKSYAFLLRLTEYLWYIPEFKILHNDPRWQQLIDRLGKEFNYDYNTS